MVLVLNVLPNILCYIVDHITNLVQVRLCDDQWCHAHRLVRLLLLVWSCGTPLLPLSDNEGGLQVCNPFLFTLCLYLYIGALHFRFTKVNSDFRCGDNFLLGVSISLAKTFSLGASISFIEASFCCAVFSFAVAFSFAEDLCDSFFLSFTTVVVVMVFYASPLAALLVLVPTSDGVSQSLSHLLIIFSN